MILEFRLLAQVGWSKKKYYRFNPKVEFKSKWVGKRPTPDIYKWLGTIHLVLIEFKLEKHENEDMPELNTTYT